MIKKKKKIQRCPFGWRCEGKNYRIGNKLKKEDLEERFKELNYTIKVVDKVILTGPGSRNKSGKKASRLKVSEVFNSSWDNGGVNTHFSFWN